MKDIVRVWVPGHMEISGNGKVDGDANVKLNDDPYSDFFGYLKPCPHLHFNMDIVNRETLSREQHLNILATPKGYRWEELSKKKDGPTYTKKPRIICGGRRLKKEEKIYIQNFLAELWTLFTPDLENRLKGVLMNEFGLKPTEAEEFLVEQRKINVKRSSTVGVSENTWYCPANLTSVVYERRENARRPCPKISPGLRHYWIKEFAQNMANSINAYIMTMLSVKRTKRTQCFSEVILKLLGNIIGEEFTLDSPKTKLQNLCVFVADRLGVLLGGITCTADVQLNEMLQKLEEKEKEVSPATPPPEEPEPEEPEIVEEVEEEEEEEKEKEEIDKSDKEAETEEEAVEDEIEAVEEEDIKEQVAIVEEEEEEEEQEEEEEEEVPKEEEPEVESQVPEPGGKVDVFEIKKPVEEEIIEEPLSKQVTPAPIKVEVVEETIKEPEKEEEPQRVSDVMDAIFTWITETNPEETSRQQDLSKVIQGQLENAFPSEDDKIIEGIKTVTEKVATWVDKLVQEVEKEFGTTGPVVKPKAKPVFRIKKDYGAPCYHVKAIPSELVLQKVKEGRSKQAKALTGAINKRPIKTTGVRKPKGMADWASWATDVASVAESWAGWIDETCTQLAQTADKHKEGKLITRETWVKIKRETANKAIEWHKNKLLLKEAAKLWEKKFKK